MRLRGIGCCLQHSLRRVYAGLREWGNDHDGGHLDDGCTDIDDAGNYDDNNVGADSAAYTGTNDHDCGYLDHDCTDVVGDYDDDDSVADSAAYARTRTRLL